ncbi:DUF5005 domain-containing protein [Agromyces sp. SYSU K20354]|uniref:DUF4185 domain-containing protein n=1 Tax=Agromyces cavernae TaxID=2898659 RepID=UPI001E3153FE|nr:DUF4185 domain-containing protein [Agromyces cavernae]MCD2443230.1 DUF5005 domain-containing protein [Agromyces cavernae]
MPQRIRTRSRRIAITSTIGALAIVTTSVPLSAAAATTCTDITASVDTELRDRFGEYGDTAGRWTGADSAYSVELPDGRIAWIYSDTFLGAVNETHGRPLDSMFIHNSINVDDDGEIVTYTGGTPEAPESLVKVAGADEGKDWYWFGDATVHDDELQVMLVEFVKTGDTMWDFKFAGNGVATFDASTLELRSVDDITTDGINWGSAIYEDGGYTYVYGVEDLGAQKFAHLARVAGGDLADGQWEYLGEAGWSTDPTSTKRILEGVSNEFSVSKFQGRYTLVTGDATEILSSKVVMYRSESVEGPFTGKTVLYSTPETGGNIFTYNAKAHPQLGDGHTLFITYNVNSFDTNDLYVEVDNYRPRYVAVDTKVKNGRCD